MQAPAAAAPDAPAERGRLRHGALLAAAVTTVVALFTAAHLTDRPLFLVRPPITRRSSGFYEFPAAGCAHSVAQGTWTDGYITVQCTNATAAEFGTCADTPQRHWRFSEAARACGARRFSAAAAREMLGGQLLVFAGDSIARNLYGATLRLLGTPGQDIVVGHQDFAHELEGGIRLQFFWAPYPANLTAVLGRLGAAQAEAAGTQPAGGRRLLDEGQPPAAQQAAAQQVERPGQTAAAQQQAAAATGGSPDPVAGGQQQGQEQQQQQQLQGQQPGAPSTEAVGELPQEAQQLSQRPALVTLSATLWHLLHMTTADGFEAELMPLGRAAAAFAASAAGSSAQGSSRGSSGPRLVLASGTEMFPNRMKTAQKQHSMTPQNLDAYNRAMQQAGLLAPAGPLALLDLFPLTQQCGEECSTDGVHSVPQVYDAALQLLLNVVAAPTRRGSGGSSPIVGGQPGPARRRLRERGPLLPWRRVVRP